MSLENVQVDIILNVQGLSALGTAEQAMGRLVQAADGVTRSQDAQVNKQGRFNNLLGEWGTRLSAVERSYDAVFRAGMHLVMLGQQLTGIYRAGINVITDATTKWGEFQTQLIKTSNSIGGIVQGTPMWNALATAVEHAAIQLGVYDPTKVAEGVYYWEGATGQNIRTQKDLSTAMSGLIPLLELAYMKNIDMKTAIYGVEGSMRMFGMSVTDSTKVAAFFFDIVNKNALEMSDLVGAMSQVGPVAKQYRMSIYDTATALAALADNGIKGTRAGMVLRQELTKIGSPTTKATKELNALFETTKGLGKSYMDIVFPNGKFIGFTNYIHDMALATQGLTDKQKALLFGTVATQREASGLIATIDAAQATMKNGGAASGAVVDSMAVALKAFSDGWDNVTKSWDYLTKAFQNAILPILYAIGASAQATLGPLIEMATTVLTAIGDWVNENPALVQLAEKIGGVLVVAAGLAGAFFSVMGSLTLLAAGIGVVVQGFGGVLLTFGVMGGIIAALVAAIVSNVGGMKDAVFNFIDAISGFFSALIGGNDKFKITWNDVTGFVTRTISDIAPKIAGFIDNVSGVIRSISQNKEVMAFLREFGVMLGKVIAIALGFRVVSGLLGPIVGMFKDIAAVGKGALSFAKWLLGLKILKAAFKTFGSFLKKTFLAPVAEAFAGVAAAISVPVAVVVGFVALIVAVIAAYVTNFMGFRDKVNGFFTWVANQLRGPVGAVMGLLHSLWAPIQKLLDIAIPALKRDIAQLAAAIGPVFEYLGNLAITVFQNIIIPTVQKVGGAIMSFWNTIKGPLLDFLGAIRNLGFALYTVFVNVIGVVLGAAWTYISKFIEQAMPYFRGFADFFIRVLGGAFRLLGDIISTTLDAIGTVVKGALEVLTGVFNLFADILMGRWGKLWDDIGGILRGAKDIIVGVIKKLWGIVTSVFDAGVTVVSTIIEFIFGQKPGSIYATIMGAVKTVGDAIGSVVGAIKKAVGDAPAAVGKLAEGIGGAIVGGIQTGLGFIGGVFNFLVDIGRNIIGGIWDGITGVIGWFHDQISKFASNLPQWIKDLLGIKSPSTVMAEIGRNIIEGMGVGITSSPAALNAMKVHTSALIDAAKQGSMQASAVLAGYAPSSMAFTTNSDRTVRVQVDVTSSDGSVDKLKAADISNALQGSDLVRTLTHMASVA